MVQKRAAQPKTDENSSAVVSWMLKAKSVPKKKIKLLLDAEDQIRETWGWDRRGTEGFPFNTASLLAELEARLKGWRPRKIRLLPEPKVFKAPTRLSDILPEKVVEQVHEYLYEEPFQGTLDEVRSADSSAAALARIKHTVETALNVATFGEEQLPAPRGNWLHRQILGTISRGMAPAKFTDSEMAELFDHFCPCGIKHNREAMKKFRWRHARR